MRMKRRRLFAVFAAVLLLSACIYYSVPSYSGANALAESISGSDLFKEANVQGQTIDMYLIGGQSNASGNSLNIPNGVAVNEVLYIGEREENIGQSGMFCANSVTTGLGINTLYMGPEYGMALRLREQYSVTNPACIFKSAEGGTNLLDVTTGNLPSRFGNWYPRSLWDSPEHDGVSHTGYLYYRFIENFKAAYNLLVSKGYTPVVKAFCWMQGESDRGAVAEYEKLIKIFIRDMREDIGKITNTDQSGLLFIMGEISTTFSSYDQQAGNQMFIDMQREVAACGDPVKVVTVDTSDLRINGPGGAIIGSDKSHWNGTQMKTLGERFAEKALEYADKNYISLPQESKVKVSVDKLMFDYGDQVNITFSPLPDYFYENVKLNGQDITSQITNNIYTIASASGNYELTLDVREHTFYNITYSYDKERGDYDRRKSTAFKLYEGDDLIVVPKPKDGYYIGSVTFNGTALSEGVNGRYILEGGVTESGEVKIEFYRDGETAQDNAAPVEESGCGKGADAAKVLSIAAALVMAAFVLKKF